MRSISYDTETTGLYPHKGDEMFSFSTGTKNGLISVSRLDGPKKRVNKNHKFLEKIWSNTKLCKTMHNAKFDLLMTEKRLGRQLDDQPIHDTMIMSHLLQNQHSSHALKDLAWELAGYPKDDETEVKKYLRGKKGYHEVPEDVMDAYQVGDAERTTLLELFFWPKVEKEFLDIYEHEIALLRPTMRMEQRGIMVNEKSCLKMIDELNTEVVKIMRNIERFAGREINLNKPDDVRWLLYKKLKLPILERTKKKGNPTTKKDIILKLREDHPHEILNMVMKCKSYKRGTTTLAGYLDHADSDGIIHPNIRTCGASTGRESCSDPNLQNVTKSKVLLNPYPIRAREVFRPKPGYVNFHLDYSGIEIRLAVHYSRDSKMIKIMNDGDDPHNYATELFFGKKYKDANKSDAGMLRAAGKNGHFGIIYGAGVAKFSGTLALRTDQGAKAMEEYGRVFPGMRNLNKGISEEVRRDGYTETIFGRRLFLAKDKAYIGTNHKIQGTAGEIFKRGQVRAHHYLEMSTGGEVGMILPIHDELVIEFPRDRLKDSGEILRGVIERMIDFPQLNVPLEVDIKVSTCNWEHTKEYKI